ncbi:MAG: HAD-IA family hydrolase [Pseudomonadales bacterium]|nr:HAD-IA family hydrolase [Pseudomonadales bacterium]
MRAEPARAIDAVIRLVTFDLDNTLWSVDVVIGRAERRMRDWLRPRVPEYRRLAKADHAALRDGVIAANPGIVHDISLLRERVLAETIEHCGYPRSRAAELAAGAFAEFLDWRHRIDFFAGALDVLETLSGSYTLASLTNGNADFVRLGLDRYFSFGYCAADVGASKPHTAMFERALAHAGVPAHEAVHIGDHLVDDVEGASAAGMATVWVNLVGSDATSGATATVTCLEDLPATVADLGAARS